MHINAGRYLASDVLQVSSKQQAIAAQTTARALKKNALQDSLCDGMRCDNDSYWGEPCEEGSYSQMETQQNERSNGFRCDQAPWIQFPRKLKSFTAVGPLQSSS
jgi:hypothetical protein